MARKIFNEDEKQILDRLIGFLSSSQNLDKLIQDMHEDPKTWPELADRVLVVCGNWYDAVHKAAFLASAHAATHADILLTGGRDARFTSSLAVSLGGEPFLLQRELSRIHGLPLQRMIIYSGSQNTNDNIRAALHYAKQVSGSRQGGQVGVHLHFIEEAFLVRREAAGLAAMLATEARRHAAESAESIDGQWVLPPDPTELPFVESVLFTAVGAKKFGELAALHGGQEHVAVALLWEELDRLWDEDRIKKGWIAEGATHTLTTELKNELTQLYKKHVAALQEGLAVLRNPNREEFLQMCTPDGAQDLAIRI